ncbi:interferon-induced helicase C domain-containing protein 1 isoform X2 [Bombina bombina]|uniref:interferon-induced helicase C domain-containing protein 1 isoform X2 n=1 Tax=Bombina bombina TaxID=8345 RepID=UPI00235A9476|nr:interferon-induced helicase C domain-containing protein 1 isoform X2 [Bombina bombina]
MSQDHKAEEDININMIRCFRKRLIETIDVSSVLDSLHSLEKEVKERIKCTKINEGDVAAARLFLDHLEKGPRPPGWFEDLVTALKNGQCTVAAMYIKSEDIPSPSLEAKYDCCEKLIQILCPELVQNILPEETALKCLEKGICTNEDMDAITAVTRNRSSRDGNRELLSRITKKKNWFPIFVDILRQMGCDDLKMFEDDIAGESSEITKPLEEPTDQNSITGENNTICDVHIEYKENENHDLRSGNIILQSSAQSEENSGMTKPHEETIDKNGVAGEDKICVPMQHKENEMSDLENVAQASILHSSTSSDDNKNTSGASSMPGLTLRDYQMEVARPALEGKNIIVCLPTGSGKTRVAVYITRDHLEKRRMSGLMGKAIVLVNKVPLVDQLFSKEFRPLLKDSYQVIKISGDSPQKITFPKVVKNNDVIICTAQILENYLIKSAKDEEEGVKLSDFSLLIIDECHHTQKEAVYNSIMTRYIKQKLKSLNSSKTQDPEVQLPQIVGLTASPGVGGASDTIKAVEHILKICANLDACEIKTVKENFCQLQNLVKEPVKKHEIAEEKKENPFEEKIKEIMLKIQNYSQLYPTSELGSQSYEQWVVQKEKSAATEEKRKEHVCAEHLRKYNDALQINNTIRMDDALMHLIKFYNEEKNKKYILSETNGSPGFFKADETDSYLIDLFYDYKGDLEKMARNPEYENEKLVKLRRTLLEEFTKKSEARGIIFTKTRQSAAALYNWICDNDKFKEVGIRAHYLIGAGNNSDFKAMTQNEQKKVINKFSTGELNLLIATTVAEEGLDIKECNVVIRYGLVTNEIAMVQARGRARAGDSTYVLVASSSSGAAEHEDVNEYKEKMMHKAIQTVQNMDHDSYIKKIRLFQMQSITEKRLKRIKKKTKTYQSDPSMVKFLCRKCSKFVCSGKDIQVIENMHHVNTAPDFKESYSKKENSTLLEKLGDCQTRGEIICKTCGRTWGPIMVYKGFKLPCLKICNFVVKYDDKKEATNTYNQWSELPIRFPAFDYSGPFSLSDDDEDDE